MKKTLANPFSSPRHLSSLLSRFITGIKFHAASSFRMPRHVTLMITSRCNASCIMCSIPKKGDYGLSITEIENTLSDNFFDSIQSICIAGGEPFLRKDLPDVIKTIFERRPKIRFLSMLTNGLMPLLIENAMKEIISLSKGKSELDLCISISLLGKSNKTYRQITNVQDGYTRVTDTIQRTKQLRGIFPLDIRLNTVIQPMNVTQLKDLLSLASQLGLPIRFIPVQINSFFDNLQNKDKLTFKDSDILSLKGFFARPQEGISESSRAYWNDYFKVINGMRRRTPCVLPFDGLVIGAGGEVFTCMAPLTYGNVLHEKLSSIWNSTQTRNTKSRLIKEYCPHCTACCAAEDSIQQEFFFLLNFVMRDFFKRRM